MRVDVLVVAAHPDDAEVGCGATIAHCVRSGATVAIVDLTDAENSTSGTPQRRAAEARSAAEVLGVTTRISVGLPDGQVGLDPGHRLALGHVIRSVRPRVVLAPYHVVDRHPDHAAAGRLAREASFLAGVGRIGTGEPHRPERIYHYMLHHMFTPDFVVDVSAVWDVRERAVDAYASQFGQPPSERRTAIGGPDFRRLLEARAETFGAMIGVAYGEAFCCDGPIGVADLPGLDQAPTDLLTYRAFL